MSKKTIQHALYLETLIDEIQAPTTSFNIIFNKKAQNIIKKLKTKILTTKKKFFTSENLKKFLKNKKFILQTNILISQKIKNLKEKVKEKQKSIFTKQEKMGQTPYFKDIKRKYQIRRNKLVCDWNTITFLIELENYLFDFLKRGGYVPNIVLNKKYKEELGNVIYTDKNQLMQLKDTNNENLQKNEVFKDLDIKNISIHPNKLILNFTEENYQFDLQDTLCFGCKKQLSTKMVKFHIKSKIHTKHSYRIYFPDSEYFNYLLNLYAQVDAIKKKSSSFYFHCEICCNNESNNDCKNNLSELPIINCMVEVLNRKRHFSSSKHIDSLIKSNICVEKGNYIFKKKIAESFTLFEDEELEDASGNVYDKKTYLDLEKLGLI